MAGAMTMCPTLQAGESLKFLFKRVGITCSYQEENISSLLFSTDQLNATKEHICFSLDCIARSSSRKHENSFPSPLVIGHCKKSS